MKKIILLVLVSVGLMNIIGCCSACSEKNAACPIPKKIAAKAV